MTDYVYATEDNRLVRRDVPMSHFEMVRDEYRAISGPEGMYAFLGVSHDGERTVLGSMSGDLSDCCDVMAVYADTHVSTYHDFEVELRQTI